MSNYCVERAIIMAAGIGSRMHPVTLTTPKPLVNVNGIRMIDTIISGLHENGIHEIYVVVGYKKEQFTEWAEQYSDVTLLENPWYDTCNNIASLYIAREHLENSIILDGDQIVRNPAILTPHFDRSGYNCVWTEETTNEWLLSVNADGIATHCNRNGGSRGWQLFSISRWSADDGRQLRRHLEIEFAEKKHTDIYWDDVAMFCFPNEYQLGVFPMRPGDLIEIDSLEELQTIDASYKK